MWPLEMRSHSSADAQWLHGGSEYGAWNRTFYCSTYKTSPKLFALWPSSIWSSDILPIAIFMFKANCTFLFSICFPNSLLCVSAHPFPPPGTLSCSHPKPSTESFLYMTKSSPSHVPPLICLCHQVSSAHPCWKRPFFLWILFQTDGHFDWASWWASISLSFFICKMGMPGQLPQNHRLRG